MKARLNATFKRFLKALAFGFITGALVAFPVAHPAINSWSDLANLLPPLIFGLIVGGLNGLLMAAEKFLRWLPEIDLPSSSDTPPTNIAV